MEAALSLLGTDVLPAPNTLSFAVHCAQKGPAYHQLSLEDEQGCIANWVLPIALHKMHKKSVMLWLLPSPPTEALACLEKGTVQPEPARDGSLPDVRTKLAQGLLQLNFSGQLLRGYHRLKCMPEGNGQLWQLTPIV